jgi:hypothetical protein
MLVLLFLTLGLRPVAAPDVFEGQVREQTVRALSMPRPDSIIQKIQKLSLAGGGVTLVVDETTVRTFVDDEGKYGKKGATHSRTETTEYLDTWASANEHWKLRSRQQVGSPKVWIDKPVSDTR